MTAADGPAVELRPATAADAERLLAWRSEPSTVAASFAATAPDPDEHEAWLAGVLVDPGRRLWIVEADGEPVGQVRLDRLDGPGGEEVEEISVSIAEVARGRGLATAAIRAASRRAAVPIVARIRPTNAASLRAFTAAGFAPPDPPADAEADDGVVVLRREPEVRDPGAT